VRYEALSRKYPALQTADCAGVKKGVNYAVLVGEKVYTLKRSDHVALDELSKLVWDQAKVTNTRERRCHFSEVGRRRQIGAEERWLRAFPRRRAVGCAG
jgi:hypothetical protein